MAQPKKWLSNSPKPWTVRDAGLEILPKRLRAVSERLRFASDFTDEDVELVHALRVAVRRACAGLELFAEALPRKEVKWWRKKLRSIRRAAGRARDLDVLRIAVELDQRPGADHWRGRLIKQRRQAQRPIARQADKLLGQGAIDRHLRRLKRSLEKPSEVLDQPYDLWFRHYAGKIYESFASAAQAKQSDLSSLHQLRVKGKALRYAIECAPGAQAQKLQADLYPQCESIQERLGLVNDSRVAMDRLHRARRQTLRKETKRYLERLWCEEAQRLDERQIAFNDWWERQRPEVLAIGDAEFGNTPSQLTVGPRNQVLGPMGNGRTGP